MKTQWQSRVGLALVVGALVAFGAGLVFGYYGDGGYSVPGYRCEVENICGTGPSLTVTPEVVATATNVMMPEVVSVAQAPRLSVAEVVVRGHRS